MTRARGALATLARVSAGVLLIFSTLLAGTAAAQRDDAPERLTVRADGHPMAVWVRRAPHAKGAILLLHGRTWSARPDFDLTAPGGERSVMRLLVAHGYTVYALDARGYGATPRDSTGWLTPTRAAADVAEVLRVIAAQTPGGRLPTLFGWSYGSMVAHLTAQSWPERMSALVLYGYPFEHAAKVPSDPSPASPPRERNTAKNAASDFISPAVTPRPVIDAYVVAALQADSVRADWRNIEEWNALDPAKVRVPTLVLQGERDPLAPTAALARLFTALGTPDRAWVVLPGGDHAAMLENTEPAFIAAVIDFIERPSVAPAAP